MENSVIRDIEKVEEALQAKLRELKASDEEENKEQAFIASSLSKLKASLLSIVDRVIDSLNIRLKKNDPLYQIKEEIRLLEKRIEGMKRKWEEVEEVKMKERGLLLLELDQIIEKLSLMKPRNIIPLNLEDIFHFEPE